MNRTLTNCLRLLAGLAPALTLVPSAVLAQDDAGVIHACYVPTTGLIYRIKEDGLSQACLAETHVEFTLAAGVIGGARILAGVQDPSSNQNVGLATPEAVGAATAAGMHTGGFFANGDVEVVGDVSATSFVGDGALLTNLTAANIAPGTITATFVGDGSGITNVDHGDLTGLTDDDHTQYLLADGTRALTGALSAGGNKLANLAAGTAAGDAVRFEQAVLDGDAAGGDLSGTFPNPTVAKLQGTVVSATAPTTGQVLRHNGTEWTPTTPVTHTHDLGDDNTAVGLDALSSNTSGHNNTAVGARALLANTIGSDNTATGLAALRDNTTGKYNTATGYRAMQDNTTGDNNTGSGYGALRHSTTGNDNVATGYQTAEYLSGNRNTAIGHDAGRYAAGDENTLIGLEAGRDIVGNNNLALGAGAGLNATTGDNNIFIVSQGVAGDAATIKIGTQGTHTSTFIAGIEGTPLAGTPVVVTASGQLGTGSGGSLPGGCNDMQLAKWNAGSTAWVCGEDNDTQYTDPDAVAAMGAKDNANALNHDRYTDAEAVTAMGVKANSNALNHDRYSDAESVTAMGAKANSNALNHDRYTDAESVTAMGAKDNSNTLNHDRYTDAEAVAAVGATGFGSWTASSAGTVFQATTDGFVIVHAITTETSQTFVAGFTDSSPTASTKRLELALDGNGFPDRGSFTMPVRSGDYWQVTIASNGSVALTTLTVSFLPIGT